MYSLTEQRFLLELLKAKQTGGYFKQPRSYYYKTMKLLQLGDHIDVVNTDPLEFELNILGECIASLVAKHPTTPKTWLKYAHTVEMYLLRRRFKK